MSLLDLVDLIDVAMAMFIGFIAWAYNPNT